MADRDILLSDLNDISEILNNNGHGGWCTSIRKAVELLKEQPQIVRCKDCRHYTGKDCNYNDIFPAPRKDWYCADGERRQKNE